MNTRTNGIDSKTLLVVCDYCGVEFERPYYRLHRHNFCSKLCMNMFSRKSNPRYIELKDYTSMSAHMRMLNAELNPTRMTESVRNKLSAARRKPESEIKSYKKRNGRHEHRAIAEMSLGRPLEKGEIVHHKDGNKLNNSPDNLEVMTQSEHVRLHAKLRRIKRGDVV